MPMNSDMYRTIKADAFPQRISVSFHYDDKEEVTHYEKVLFDGQGLRYGDNPDQSAAWYRKISPKGAVETSQNLPFPIQVGKHPSKTNISDIYSAVRVLTYIPNDPTVIIVKHGNPCGAAIADTIDNAFECAHDADRIAAFGGVIVSNREVSKKFAMRVTQHFFEVLAAPRFTSQALEILGKKKSLSVFQTPPMSTSNMECRMLLDGSLLMQTTFEPVRLQRKSIKTARTEYQGKEYCIKQQPSEEHIRDMRFGWILQSAVMSNAIVFIKDQKSIAIAAGAQDRVGAVKNAVNKAYRNAMEYRAHMEFEKSFDQLPNERQMYIRELVHSDNAGLRGSVMISDGFFPFPDAVQMALKEGVQAILQPGGSIRDYASIIACNEGSASMVFTGQRGFLH